MVFEAEKLLKLFQEVEQ